MGQTNRGSQLPGLPKGGFMGKFEEYSELKTNIEKQEFYSEEKQKGFPSGDMPEPLSVTGLADKFAKRVQHETTFEERTRYYFEDYKMMDSKVQRYRHMASDQKTLNEFASTHNNHKANDRKDYALKAADNFEAASKLALSLDTENTKGFALYQHREKIMRLRMKGMENAAKAKSTDAADEKYRILKGKMSCLTILKDQLEVLGLDESLSVKEKIRFENELLKINNEIETVKNDLKKKIQTPQQKWEKEQGLDDAAVKTAVRNKKRNYPYITNEAEKIAGTLSRLYGETDRPEYETAFDNMIKKKTYPNLDKSKGNIGRIVSHPCFFVLRDKKGNPINSEEGKKAEWNKKWLDAVGKNDRKTMNAMLKETYERVERLNLPTPEELKKNGAVYYFKKDPAAFYQMVHLCLTLENMKPHDEFVRNYCETHPLFEKKANMGRMLGNMLDNELLQSKYLINVKAGAVKKVTKDTIGYQHALDRNYQQFIDESLATYTEQHSGLKED